jgi:hypothetical protein
VGGGINPCFNPSLRLSPAVCALSDTCSKCKSFTLAQLYCILIDTSVESDLPQSLCYCRYLYFQVLTMSDWKEPLSCMSILARKSRSSAKGYYVDKANYPLSPRFYGLSSAAYQYMRIGLSLCHVPTVLFSPQSPFLPHWSSVPSLEFSR